MTLRDYVLAFRRNWAVVVVAVVVGLVTAGTLAFTTPPTYRASAQVIFTGHDPGSGQDQAFFGSYLQSRMSTYAELAESTKLLTSAAETIGSRETAEDLRTHTKIEVSERDTAATISVTDEDAELSARAADAVAEALLVAVARLEPEFATSPKAGSGNASITGTISHRAVVPTASIAPNTILYLLAGALGGLVVSVLVIAYREVWRKDPQTSLSAEGH